MGEGSYEKKYGLVVEIVRLCFIPTTSDEDFILESSNYHMHNFSLSIGVFQTF